MPIIYQESWFPNNTHNLSKSKRIFPQNNDTGGFFLAKFKKIKDFDFKLIEEYL